MSNVLPSISCNNRTNTLLPSQDAVMRNKHGKLQLWKGQNTYGFGWWIYVESSSEGVYIHDEVDVPVISYLFIDAKCGT